MRDREGGSGVGYSGSFIKAAVRMMERDVLAPWLVGRAGAELENRRRNAAQKGKGTEWAALARTFCDEDKAAHTVFSASARHGSASRPYFEASAGVSGRPSVGGGRACGVRAGSWVALVR